MIPERGASLAQIQKVNAQFAQFEVLA